MMKLLSPKSGLIVVFALCVLGFGIYVFRQKPRTVLPPFKRYPHAHLQTSALEPNAQLQQVDYTLRNGETLAGVARLRYAHQHYYRVIKLYNHLADEHQVAADYKLRLPEMSVILAEEGLNKVAAQEVAAILCARAKYDRVVKQLWALRVETTNTYQLPEAVRQELLEAADDLQQATENLKQPRSGVTTGVPRYMIRLLEQNVTSLRGLADGDHADPKRLRHRHGPTALRPRLHLRNHLGQRRF
jgi:hypothetical protein